MYPVIQISALSRSTVAYFATYDEAVRYAAATAQRPELSGHFAYEAANVNVAQPVAPPFEDAGRQLQNAVLAYMNQSDNDAVAALKAVLEFLHFDIDEDGSYMLAYDSGEGYNETLYVSLSEEV